MPTVLPSARRARIPRRAHRTRRIPPAADKRLIRDVPRHSTVDQSTAYLFSRDYRSLTAGRPAIDRTRTEPVQVARARGKDAGARRLREKARARPGPLLSAGPRRVHRP